MSEEDALLDAERTVTALVAELRRDVSTATSQPHTAAARENG